MKYVIVEKETGTQHIFETFAKALEYIDEWCGKLEMSDEQKYNAFVEYHQTFVI